MKTFFVLGCCILMLRCTAQQLPPGVKMTTIKKTKLVRVRLIVPAQFKDKIYGDHVLNVPEGYSARVFYAGRLDK
jgi:hypothetical protein